MQAFPGAMEKDMKKERNRKKTLYSFRELFDIKEVQRIQDAFSKASGVASIITELDGTSITRPSGFFQKRLSGGLCEGGADIVVDGRHIATWFIGQVLDCSEIPEETICEFLYLNAKMLSGLAMRNTAQTKEINRRIKTETMLATEKESFRVTLKSIGDAVITTDIEGRITMLNPVAERLTGWKNIEAKGQKLDRVFHLINEKTRRRIQSPISKILRTGRISMLAEHTVLLARDGTEKFISDSGAPIMSDNGKVQGVVLVFRDITKEKKQQDRILYLSYNDKLTGLYNRAYFEKQLKRLNLSKKYPISVIIGDLNGLKLTNDLFGHEEGDKLLMSIAAILKSVCRKDDVVARWGGDEFAILLPETGLHHAVEICGRIKNLCSEDADCAIRPNIALGAAVKEDASVDLKEIIKKAERRMYRNKLMEGNSTRTGTVASLKKTLFDKSYETEEHAQRLAELSHKIGIAMGIPAHELEDLELVAILHDVGKVAIPDAILNKKGTLTAEEWIEMKKHSEIGYRIVQSSFELSHIAEYVLCHHERWDGKGYPQGRKTTAIPLLSRIVTVADSYDTMTRERPYKNPLTCEAAVRELESGSGSQFDPEIVKVFTGLLSNDPFMN